MLSIRYLIAIYVCGGLCTGSGVTFIERDTFVKLRSEGLANIGYVRSGDPDDYVSRLSLTFGQFALLTPGSVALFKTGSSSFDIQPSGFRRHRDLSVHGMSMIRNIPAVGVVLTMKGAILKQNGLLRVGDDDVTVRLRRGDVIISFELSPAEDEQTCIACQVDVGHVIQLEYDVTHVGDPEFRELTDSVSVLRSYEYGDRSRVYIPEQVFIDGIAQRPDLIMTGSENSHNVIMRLPAPLGQKMQVNVIFRIAKPAPETTTATTTTTTTTTTATPVPTIRVERERHERKRTDSSGPKTPDDDGGRSRDRVNMADEERGRQVYEIHYTTTTASVNKENESKVVLAVKDQLNGAITSHRTSVLAALLAISLLLV